jgi:hypothetical protein
MRNKHVEIKGHYICLQLQMDKIFIKNERFTYSQISEWMQPAEEM